MQDFTPTAHNSGSADHPLAGAGVGWSDPDAGEALLVRRAMAGDREATSALWARHRGWVAAVILAHKPREAEVDDLVQDVAATFVRSATTLRDPATFRPWLRTIAINATLAAGRQATRRRQGMEWRAGDAARGSESVAGDSIGRLDTPPTESLTAREDHARMLALVQRVPDGYREPLIMKCVQGMSYRQIGVVMGLPETTIETRIARGRRMLRELLEADSAPAARANSATTSQTKP